MADLRRAYIDSCCFIDIVKTSVGQMLSTEKEEDVWFLKRLLEANRDGEVVLFTSTMTVAECSHVGEQRLSDKTKSEFNRLLTSGQYVRLVQATPFIAQDARNLRWDSGIELRGMDSVHVASALAMKCEEFISSNGKLIKVQAQGAKLQRLSLYPKRAKDTAILPAKYLQLDALDGETRN